MKSIFRLILFGAFVLLITSVVVSQQRTVTKAEIQKLQADAEAKLEKLSYREKRSHINFFADEKSPYFTSTRITEVVLRPSRVRSVSESKDKQGISRTELIGIGNRLYLKEGDGPWRISKYLVIDAEDADIFQLKTNPVAIYKYDYLYLGEENVNGISADVYQASTREVYRLQSFDIVDLSVGKFWFDKKKRLLKKQFNSTNGTQQFHSTTKLPKEFEDIARGSIVSEQEIIEYEYDIPIKIEAPIK